MTSKGREAVSARQSPGPSTSATRTSPVTRTGWHRACTHPKPSSTQPSSTEPNPGRARVVVSGPWGIDHQQLSCRSAPSAAIRAATPERRRHQSPRNPPPSGRGNSVACWTSRATSATRTSPVTRTGWHRARQQAQVRASRHAPEFTPTRPSKEPTLIEWMGDARAAAAAPRRSQRPSAASPRSRGDRGRAGWRTPLPESDAAPGGLPRRTRDPRRLLRSGNAPRRPIPRRR